MSISDLNTHDFFDIALGLLSILGTVVGLIASVVALRISADSNALAAKAVEISSFTHKKEVAPNLTLTWSPDESGEEVILVLRNEAPGKAIIKALQSNFKNLVFLKPVKFPITLLLNGIAIFSVPTDLDPSLYQQASKLRDEIKEKLIPSWFVFFFEDIIGTRYKVVFRFNAIGNYLTPELEELDPKYQGTRQYFE